MNLLMGFVRIELNTSDYPVGYAGSAAFLSTGTSVAQPFLERIKQASRPR